VALDQVAGVGMLLSGHMRPAQKMVLSVVVLRLVVSLAVRMISLVVCPAASPHHPFVMECCHRMASL
jgi:hypothetical protein